MKVGLKYTSLVLLLLLIGSFAYLCWNPYWLIDHTVNLYMKEQGIQHRYVSVDGYNIHYLEAQYEGNGPDKPLLLIHGLGARASDWSRVIPALAHAGYHVYALDLLGYGLSPKPPDGDVTLDGEEHLTIDFLRALKIPKADIGGWSMGGWVAMKLALDHPEMVRRLMVYDSAGMYFVLDFSPTLFSPSNRAEFERLMDHIEPDQRRTKIPSIFIPGMIHRFQRNSAIVQKSFASMVHGRELLDFRARRLAMPMLIVWGTEDHLTPLQTGLRLHGQVPQSVFVGVSRCGHLTAAECPDQVIAPTVQFLNADPPMPPSTTFVEGPK